MSILKKTYRILSLTTAALLLLVLSACNMVTGDDDIVQQEPVANYINLTLYVSSGETSNITRAPIGGEDGDAREAGFNRENTVSGVTVILYKGTGLDDASAKVDFVRYFTVTEEGRDPQGTTYNYEAATTFRSEARYTTGDQKLAKDELDFTATYHVLLVANQDVSPECPKGTFISTVRDKVITNVYSTATPQTPWTAQQFVMTSERDATIDFKTMAPVQKTSGEAGLVYRVLQPLLIERMSARIDYCTKGGSYNPTLGGYEYSVGSTGDKFVVTSVTPFNMNPGSQYLFKRVCNAWPATTTTYLGDETTTNYVVEPSTSSKDNSIAYNFLNPISAVNTALAANTATAYTQAMANETVQNNAKFTDANGYNNIIIAYPKENTLMLSSYLKMYATGIAFAGDYYFGGTGTPEKRVYYHFLRHQGELATGAYQAKQWADISDTEASGGPMNYGIVRNNIYRVDISGISAEGLDIHIKVKKWDMFTHEVIYM